MQKGVGPVLANGHAVESLNTHSLLLLQEAKVNNLLIFRIIC